MQTPMILRQPKTCTCCGKVYYELPSEGSPRFDGTTETWFWECSGSYGPGDQCNSTMCYMPDFERSMSLLVTAYHAEKGVK